MQGNIDRLVNDATVEVEESTVDFNVSTSWWIETVSKG